MKVSNKVVDLKKDLHLCYVTTLYAVDRFNLFWTSVKHN